MTPRADGNESVDDKPGEKPDDEDDVDSEASEEEDSSVASASDGASESGDGVGPTGLAALVGADIDEEESGSDFEPSDDGPGDSSDDDDESSSDGKFSPEHDAVYGSVGIDDDEYFEKASTGSGTASTNDDSIETDYKVMV